MALLAYAALGPAVVAALRAGEPVTAMLLALPPVLATVLTGPIPARVAPAMTTASAFVLALVAPFVLGAIFLRVPILPAAAVEVAADPPTEPAVSVLLGRVITVNDRMTIVLDTAGSVRFVPNERVAPRRCARRRPGCRSAPSGCTAGRSRRRRWSG